jgi:hypothetical protein
MDHDIRITFNATGEAKKAQQRRKTQRQPSPHAIAPLQKAKYFVGGAKSCTLPSTQFVKR